MSQHPKQILEQANAAITVGDFDGFLKFCTDDTEWNFLGERTLKGKDAVRRYMEATYREPPQFKVRNLIAEGDFVVAVGEITVKDAAGKATRYDYCDVWRFRGDKMSELRAFVVPQADG